MGQRTVDDLIELIYEAAVFPEKWQDAARSIAESVGGEASSVCWIDKKLGAVTRFDINNFDDSILPEYAERFGHRDPRVLKGIVSPDGTVYRDHEIIPEYGRRCVFLPVARWQGPYHPERMFASGIGIVSLAWGACGDEAVTAAEISRPRQ